MEFPKGGLIGKTVTAVKRIGGLNLPLHAANAGFFLILSLFPALMLILSLLRYTPLEVGSLISLIQGVIPAALLPEAEYLILTTYQSASGAMVGLSAVTALWSAGRGVYGLWKGLNAVYGVTESRGWLYTRCVSAVYTLLFLPVLLLTLVVHVFGTELVAFLDQSGAPFFRFLTGMVDLRFFLLLALQTALLTAMYTVLPNRRCRLRQSLPGAVLASFGWLVFTHLFSLYVENSSRMLSIYGSIYTVALSMLWLYFCILIVFYGALLNRILADRGE